MDTRVWIVAALFGLATGLGTGRYRQDRRVVRGVLLLTFLIGLVTWLVARDSIAGPSLTVGGGIALAVALLVPPTR